MLGEAEFPDVPGPGELTSVGGACEVPPDDPVTDGGDEKG
jgi:hypothetical protein